MNNNEEVEYYGAYRMVNKTRSTNADETFTPQYNSLNQIFGFTNKNDLDKWLSNDKNGIKMQIANKDAESRFSSDLNDIANRVCLVKYA